MFLKQGDNYTVIVIRHNRPVIIVIYRYSLSLHSCRNPVL